MDLYFHAEAGRRGIVDTAMGTSTTGYMFRRIMKLVEDLKITYDGTVRDEQGAILQFRHGNGLDMAKSPKPQIIHNLVADLNNQYMSRK